MTDREIKGRLVLWFWALDFAHSYLKVAKKAWKHGAIDKNPGSPRFPSGSDLHYIKQGLRSIALVKISTLVTRGDSKKGIIGKNDQKFFNKHFDLILSEIYQDSERLRIKEIIKEIVSIRHKILAHRDGEELHRFDKDGKAYTASDWQEIYARIDFEYLEDILWPILEQLSIYMDKFKE